MVYCVTNSQGETQALGMRLAACLAPGDTVLLLGDLGAGKSVLARGLGRGLGVEGPMASPTFMLMQPYEGRLPFYHFDLYRLGDPEEFYQAGLDEYIGGDGVAAVEWPGQADLAPTPRLELTLTRGADDGQRIISAGWVGMEARAARLRDALSEWEGDRA